MVRLIPHFPVLTDFLRQRAWLLSLVSVLDTASQLLRISIPIALAIAYGWLFDFRSVRGQLLQQWGLPVGDDFGVALGYFGGIVLVHLLLRAWVQWQQAQQSEALLAELRNTLFEHQLNVQMEAYEARGIGRYLLRYSGDLGSVKALFQKGILQFAADVMTLAIGLATVCTLDAAIGWTAMAFIGATLLLLWRINRRLLAVETQRRDKQSALLAFTNRCLIGMSSIKAFNRMTPELTKFRRYVTKIQRAGQQYSGHLVVRDALLAGASYALIATVLYLIHGRMQAGIAPDVVASFAIVVIFISWRTTLLRLGRVGLIWRKGHLSLTKVDTLLALPREGDAFGGQPVSASQASLQWEPTRLSIGGCTFEALPRVNLQPGSRQFIHTPSGGGKSTLTKLLAGLYSAAPGSIRIGTTTIDEADLKDWRRQITYVSTSFPLYGRTVGEALAYSPRHYAKAKALLAEWQTYFPELCDVVWDTPLREVNRLSSSQVLLLLWLRASLTNKPIWVLDEPFQGLSATVVAQLVQLIPAPAAALLLSSDESTVGCFAGQDGIANAC